MVQGPIKILADADLFDAIHMIIDNRISGICVVDEHDDLVGLLSEIDCLRAILAVTYNEHCYVGKVKDYMTEEVDYCELHADLVDIADDMVKKGHRRRPVLDHGKLVGQITCRQLLRVVSEFNQNAVVV